LPWGFFEPFTKNPLTNTLNVRVQQGKTRPDILRGGIYCKRGAVNLDKRVGRKNPLVKESVADWGDP